MRRTYETVYILSTNATQEERKTIHERVLTELKSKDENLEIIHNQDWGVRSLAYKINKQDKGEYHYLAYITEGPSLDKMEFYMKITEPVMRFLTVKISDQETREVPLPKIEDLN